MRRLGERLRTGPAALLSAAILVGAGAGVAAVAFRWLITTVTHAFSGSADPSGGGGVRPLLPVLGPASVVLVPAVGGLLYGPLVDRFAREARGHGVPEVMDAVSRRGGRIRGSVALVKALASALCIGSGGSVGREGPIVQIGSALGSWVGQRTRFPEHRLRTLVACGAASGIAATFNAPVAGVVFALELILRDFAAEAFGVVVVACVVASVVGRAVLGDAPFLHLPPFTITHVAEFGLYALLGLLAGGTGVLFTRVLYGVEDACDRLWRGPEWARPAAGGLLLGLLLLALPQLYGVGYPVLGRGVAGGYALGFLVVLLAGKMLATSLTIGIGGSGGVFAPSLFCGAMLGAAFGDVAHAVAPGLAGPVGGYALVGMGAVFAGAARAPITAVLIMFELTGEYTIILPLMLAIVLATGASAALSRDTVYTLKLRRRGVDLTRPVAGLLSDRTVAEVMTAPPPSVRPDTPLRSTVGSLLARGRSVVPVVADGVFLGVLTVHGVAEVLAEDEEAAGATVADALESTPTVAPGDSLSSGFQALRSADTDVPVVDADGRLRGWLTDARLLAVLHGGDVDGGPPTASPRAQPDLTSTG